MHNVWKELRFYPHKKGGAEQRRGVGCLLVGALEVGQSPHTLQAIVEVVL